MIKIKKNEVHVVIGDNNMVTIKHTTARGTTEKYVTFDDFAKAIAASATVETDSKIAFESPILPNFYVRTIYHREYTTGAHLIILVREPEPADFTLQLQGHGWENPQFKSFEKVGMPRLLFAVKVFQNMIQNVRVCAVKSANITEETPLFNYPFSNVDRITRYGSGGVCFGSNKISAIDIKNIAGLHSVPNMFLSMPNNHDKYGHNLTEFRYMDLLELLEGQAFDNEILEPAEITLKEWINKID